MNCQSCPLDPYPRVQPFGPSEGLAVVGEAPGADEVRLGRPFVGKSGQLIRRSLELVGINPESVRWDNAYLCRPPGNKLPNNASPDYCRHRLFEGLKAQSVTKILAVGNIAYEALTGQPGKISTQRSRPVWIPELRVNMLPTYHPSAVLQTPELYTDFIWDLQKFRDLSIDEFTPDPPPDFRVCQSPLDVIQMTRDIRYLTDTARSSFLACDLETSCLEEWNGEILSCGIAATLQDIWIIPYYLLYNSPVQKTLQSLFHNPTYKWAGQNFGQFDARWLTQLGIQTTLTYDTMLLHTALDERSTAGDDSKDSTKRQVGSHDLKSLSRIYFSALEYDKGVFNFFPGWAWTLKNQLSEVVTFFRDNSKAYTSKQGQSLTLFLQYLGVMTVNERPKHLTGVLQEYQHGWEDFCHDLQNLAEQSLQKFYLYNAWDCFYTHKLTTLFLEMASQENVLQVHDRIFIPTAQALGQIEAYGSPVDREYLQDLSQTLEGEVQELHSELQLMTQSLGLENFNSNSPKQVANLLYDKLQVKVPRWVGRQTGAEILEKIPHPIAKKILEYRRKSKFKSTYVEGLLSQSESHDHRVHPEIFIPGAVTGRLSCRNPNLQNIPILAGPMIRRAFRARQGFRLIESDYSQLELRVAGWYSHDRILIESYATGVDIHKVVASEIFGISIDQVTDLQRYIAKYVDFGIIYGRGAKSLAAGELNCSEERAAEYIKMFLNRFEGLHDWIKAQHQFVLENGYVVTPFGRKRRFPLILDMNRAEILRQSINAPIQSFASDLNTLAFTQLHNFFREEKLECYVLFPVHDSTMMECREDLVDDIVPFVRYTMENICPFPSPIKFKVDIKTGERWGDLEKYKKDIEDPFKLIP